MYENELKVAINAALKAGDIILKYYNTDYEIEWKEKNDPVTIADKEANNFIISYIKSSFPDDIFIGEESSDDKRRINSDIRSWIIDPIDGTREFVDKNGEFAVMIGMIDKKKSVLGVVYQPTEGKIWYASKEHGAWLRTKDNKIVQIKTSDINRTEEFHAVITRSHHSKFIDRSLELLKINKWRKIGSVGLKVISVAQGTDDLYVHVTDKTKLWDVCGPSIILREAGGIFTDLRGEPMDYNSETLCNPYGIVGSNGKCHKEIIDKLNPVLIESGLLKI